MLFSHLNWLDYVILVLILLSIIFCYRRGFVGSTLSLVCWLAALGGSFKLAHPIGRIFENSIQSEYVRDILGFFIIFIIFALIGVLIIYLCNHLIEKAVLHKTDKVLGGFSGIVVGIFVVSALLLVARYSTVTTKPFWTSSFLIPYFHPFEDIINDMLPISVQAERDLLPDGVEKSLDDLGDSIDDTKKSIKKSKDAVADTADKIKEEAAPIVD